MTFDKELDTAFAGQAITLTLEDEIDISRGDLLVSDGAAIESSNHVLADVVWMTEQPLQLNQQYDIKIAGKKTLGQVEVIRHQYDINNLSRFDTDSLPLNGIGQCEWSLTESIAIDKYSESIDTGGFIIIDRLTNVTVGAGLVRERLDHQNNTHSVGDITAFEQELKALIVKYFPSWDAKI